MKQARFSDELLLWSKGVSNEIQFWKNWAESGGGIYADDFTGRMSGTQVFDPTLSVLFPEGQSINVLDVGAGPISPLGPVCERNPLAITATDPLASAYATIMTDCGLKPPIETIFATAEELFAFFPGEDFDLVHCRNALDHSLDPVRGIEQMLLVCKPGGFVVLRHHVNEAVTEMYDGFHQHNFDEDSGHFVIWNPEERIDVTEKLGDLAAVKTSISHDRRWIEVVIQKKGGQTARRKKSSDELADSYRERVRLLTQETFEFILKRFASGA